MFPDSAFDDLEDSLRSDEAFDPDERVLPDERFMRRTFGPVRPLPPTRPPQRDDDFSVEIDGY